jgi:hypothetical protein
MSYWDLDLRTRLLLDSRVRNGVKITVGEDEEREVMDQMVEEGLFRCSDTRFSEGYWWTPAGERAAEDAWESVPAERFETSYRDHPQVSFSLNGNKEELCYVTCASRERPLWVRESLGSYIVDHPSGMGNEYFDSADEAISWALTA